jgi:hypothetical protein
MIRPGPNGGGRKPGSRNRLSKAFIDAVAKDFEQHGEATLKILRIESPAEYCRLAASLIPKDLNLEVTNRASELREWLAWMQSPQIMRAMIAKPAEAPRAPDLPVLPARPVRPELPKVEPFNASEYAQRERERNST